jgi:hypothetical protein
MKKIRQFGRHFWLPFKVGGWSSLISKIWRTVMKSEHLNAFKDSENFEFAATLSIVQWLRYIDFCFF